MTVIDSFAKRNEAFARGRFDASLKIIPSQTLLGAGQEGRGAKRGAAL